MGLSQLTLTLPDGSDSDSDSDADTAIVWSDDHSRLTITGHCVAYKGWDSVLFTIVLSSGNSENTVMYANTEISAEYVDFSLPLVAESELLPPLAVPASCLPQHQLPVATLRVVSTSASKLPNCKLMFGSDGVMSELSPPWTINEEAHLVTNCLGLRLANSMKKGGVVERTMSLLTEVPIGGIPTHIDVKAPVDAFAQKNTWYAQHSVKQSQLACQQPSDVLDLNHSTLCLGVFGSLATSVPPQLCDLGGFSLKYYLLQYNPITRVVNSLDYDISGPTWTLVNNELTVENARIGAKVYNPFSTDPVYSRTQSPVYVTGKCISQDTQPELHGLCVYATCCKDNTWRFTLTNEDDNTVLTKDIDCGGSNTALPPLPPTHE